MSKCTFSYMVLTDGKISTMHVTQGRLTGKGERKAYHTEHHIATVEVTGRLEGVHARLNREYATPAYPAFEEVNRNV